MRHGGAGKEPMEAADLEEALQQGCTIAFDTNAIPGANILPFGRAAKHLNIGRSDDLEICRKRQSI